MKYPIAKEFFPYTLFSPPIQSPQMAGWMGSKMNIPRWIWNDRDVCVSRKSVRGGWGADVTVLLFRPRCDVVGPSVGVGVASNEGEPVDGHGGGLPCLVYFHGGGFFFEGAPYHYRLCKKYSLDLGCCVAFVQYRLAPKNPHPVPAEDCFAALDFILSRGNEWGINRSRVAVGGDSAGGALAAGVCQMARDRGRPLPLFQLLVYPVTDRRMDYDSCRKFVDTPMWNGRLSRKMWQGYLPDGEIRDVFYASPMEAEDFSGLPAAYVETAEFDCLHDEGLAYARALKEGGVSVVVNETEGTMHGFDIVEKAPRTQAAVSRRIAFMKEGFCGG